VWSVASELWYYLTLVLASLISGLLLGLNLAAGLLARAGVLVRPRRRRLRLDLPPPVPAMVTTPYPGEAAAFADGRRAVEQFYQQRKVAGHSV
jgi:hypothetical protein